MHHHHKERCITFSLGFLSSSYLRSIVILEATVWIMVHTDCIYFVYLQSDWIDTFIKLAHVMSLTCSDVVEKFIYGALSSLVTFDFKVKDGPLCDFVTGGPSHNSRRPKKIERGRYNENFQIFSTRNCCHSVWTFCLTTHCRSIAYDVSLRAKWLTKAEMSYVSTRIYIYVYCHCSISSDMEHSGDLCALEIYTRLNFVIEPGQTNGR